MKLKIKEMDLEVGETEATIFILVVVVFLAYWVESDPQRVELIKLLLGPFL